MKSVNIYKYFPIRNDEMMDAFLKEDDEYEERAKQFYCILMSAVQVSKKKITKAVVNAVFSQEYVDNHRWPTQKY